ncbi:probable LIM domain-containing serine/threonine-protein kinase DDB_G0286997 isoform X3 [Apis mellifera]|uniref:Probable LIM domain-containing serine/threonine-protein kinase DDB_G0286997 isoform X3 n=1 Tax=Apis mellifera TaxID=7460 RepID=A0A7M7LR46_APIME|nr:probable LIM domain-containing serine/threonine-protein kinase DDB_G0286997 isoform X3 [Apis mellifera]|eukprot:XP_006562679.2 probable LIM domain-containing serine/threonine-protein kinase DDB_G0286997 isoform X3 [Apis mellifera]
MRQLYLTLCLQRSTSAVVEMTPWLMAIFCLVTAGCSNVTDQQTSETHHDQQVAILKQIRKVNEDGSYTYGYEAGDGSFKEHVSVVQSIPRLNRTTTTKKPNIVYPSSTEASTKSSVVQSIPRNRKTTTTSTSTTTTTTEQPKTIFNHYLKGTGKSRPRFIINGQQRPLVIEEESEVEVDEDSQINRPTTDDKTSTYRKIIFAKRPIDQTLRPISDDFIEKEDEAKVTSGNNLRRQLHEDTTKPNPIVEGSNDDHPDVYGGSLSTTRPLFTTTTPPRVLQRVSPAARVEKPKVYVNRENLAPPRSFENVNSRAFETETKIPQEERVSQPQPVLIRGPPRVAAENREYLRQSTEPIFVRQQPDQFLPAGRILVPAQPNIEEDPAYRPLSINRILLRPLPSQQPLYSTTTDANIHYLTENPLPEQEEDPRVAMAPGYMRPRPFPRPVIFQEPRARPVLRPVSPPVTPMDEREYQTTSEYPYRSSTLALPPEPPNPINPPLSRRDFQLLLRRLLVSQYGVQALSYPKTYLEDALYDQQPYPSYQPGYQTVAPRSEIPGYDQQVPLQYGDRVPIRRPVYARPLSPVYQQYEDYNDGRGGYSKRVYRQKFYAQEVGDEGDEILPAPIREALLLRMLQLAINAERPPPVLASPVMTTTTPASRYRKTGPVRSVQIITDEEEDGKETMKKKM